MPGQGNAPRSVCYCMSRALYHKAAPSINSLLAHTRIDRMYLVIEDNEFPMRLPDFAQLINVDGQGYFTPGGPNWNQRWTHMVLMRAALSQILPNEDVVLSLDCDTIIRGDIGPLWDIDMTDWYLAGVKEPLKTAQYKRTYINFGVALMNLKRLRETRKDFEIIQALNQRHYEFPEQDCVSELCEGGILTIPGMYNATPYTEPTDRVLIRHYAANPGWYSEDEVRRWI